MSTAATQAQQPAPRQARIQARSQAPSRTDLTHLLGRLRVVEARLRHAVALRSADDPAPNDPFRGLYLSEAAVMRLLERPSLVSLEEPGVRDALTRVEDAADEAEAGGAVVPLRALAEAFELSPLDVELLLIALTPELDARFEHLFAYLNDDVTRRRPTVGLALELCGLPVASGPARARLFADAPLQGGGLLVLEDTDRPFLSRGLRVPDRVSAHLLGEGEDAARGDPALADVLMPEPPAVESTLVAALGRTILAHQLAYLQELAGGAGRSIAVQSLRAGGAVPLCVDLPRLLVDRQAATLVDAVRREARLVGGGIVAELPSTLEAAQVDLVRRLTAHPVVTILVGTQTWDPALSYADPVLAEVQPLPTDDRVAVWQAHLDPSLAELAAETTTAFRLPPEGVARAAAVATKLADLDDTAVRADHIRQAARAQNAAGLERLARRTPPDVTWQDLVVSPVVAEQLAEIALRAKHRDQVLGEWRLRPGGSRGRGVIALFAGDSGTGKTMSAEVIAGDLGLDLYSVNLATVVDKYIGETEKNLERIFAEAEGVNGVLFFDEADAIFGKRSEVRDAHDRYSNIESAYLLQRLETFDGLAVLATNLRSNLDEAFTRRFDVIVDFPLPSPEFRRQLWDRCLVTALPRAEDLDLDFCAKAFELTGGSIRSIAVTAAYLAAESQEPVSMATLIAAIQREYRKLGRLCLPSEFGSYASLLR